jgi:glutathione S-transferase
MYRLITIPASHYCEKARWALDHHGVAFEERAHVPFASRVAGLRYGVWSSVPILVTPRETIADSTAILKFLDTNAAPSSRLYPPIEDEAQRAQVEAFEELFDAKLGPHSRRVGYDYFLPVVEKARGQARSELVGPVPAAERGLAQVMFPQFAWLLRRGLRMTAESIERSRVRVQNIFAEVAQHLAQGARYLVADRLTAADVTFACLASPVVLPPQYGGVYPRWEALPRDLQDQVTRWRETPAGTFAMRLFREKRHEG